jgi:4-amino-4-deoxy-L-arabinose transferase-like glycosyltransferase
MAIAVSAAVALRIVPQFAPVVGDWAELSIRQQLAQQIAARQGKTVSEIAPAALASEVDAFIKTHEAEIEPARRALAQNYLGAITFEGEDGRRHLYLGGYDGYYWLRLARNFLARGTVCDRVVGGECVDEQANAPIGRAIDYPHSPFVWAIAATHRLASVVWRGLPLSTSATMVPILLTGLAIVPCFLLAWRMGGALAGLVAALLVFLNPFVFVRTADADNDIMVVVLPLFATWLLVEALARKRRAALCGLAAFAGVVLAVLAASWAGWPLYFLVSLAGLAAVTLVALAKRARSTVLRALLGLVCMSTAFLVTIYLFGVPIRAGDIAEHLLGTLRLALPRPRLDTAPGADMFATIGELVPVDVGMFGRALGPLGLALGVLGAPLAIAPRDRLQFWRLVAAMALAALLVLAGMQLDLGREAMLAGLAVVLAAGVFALWIGRPEPLTAPQIAALLVSVWLAATLITGSQAQRFVILVAVPLGLSAGVAVGLAASGLSQLAAEGDWRRGVAPAAAGVLALAVVAPAAIAGYREARGAYPAVNDAWTDSFAAIRRDASPDAIVNLWWDYGHWASYFTQRRVTVDGASLKDRTVQWTARAFAAPSDREAVAIFRMLGCGEVTDPDDGTRARPYEMLAKWGHDEALAYRTIIDLLRLEPSEAESYLAEQKLAPARAKALIATVYCRPPETYLVLTSGLFNIPGWALAGFWDPYRAYVMTLARDLPRDRAVAAIKAKFALTEADAETLYAEALAVHSEDERTTFAAPDARLWSLGWTDCRDDGGRLKCLADLIGMPATKLEVSFDPNNPAQVKVVTEVAGQPATEVVPALIAIARADAIDDVTPPEPVAAGLGLLIDPAGHRIFVATPGVARSTLARLILLDGRYSKLFRKVENHLAFDGQRITTWRIAPDAP